MNLITQWQNDRQGISVIKNLPDLGVLIRTRFGYKIILCYLNGTSRINSTLQIDWTFLEKGAYYRNLQRHKETGKLRNSNSQKSLTTKVWRLFDLQSFWVILQNNSEIVKNFLYNLEAYLLSYVGTNLQVLEIWIFGWYGTSQMCVIVSGCAFYFMEIFRFTEIQSAFCLYLRKGLECFGWILQL